MLRKWEDLPEFMQVEEVRLYYEKLSRKRLSLLLKRVFDFIVSSIVLVILSPVLLVLMDVIKKIQVSACVVARNGLLSINECFESIGSMH